MQALFNLLVLNSLFHYDANQINGKKNQEQTQAILVSRKPMQYSKDRSFFFYPFPKASLNEEQYVCTTWCNLHFSPYFDAVLFLISILF